MPMWVTCSCWSTCCHNTSGTTICLPFLIALLMTAMSSLNVQYGLMSCCTLNSAYNEKKYAEILLRYRRLFIKGDVFIGEWGIFGAEIFLHYRQFFVKSNFIIGRVECIWSLCSGWPCMMYSLRHCMCWSWQITCTACLVFLHLCFCCGFVWIASPLWIDLVQACIWFSLFIDVFLAEFTVVCDNVATSFLDIVTSGLWSVIILTSCEAVMVEFFKPI